MIVISDTSCIGYLIMIEKLYLLEQNFSKVIVPAYVQTEILQLSSSYNLTAYHQAKWISTIQISHFEVYNNLLNRLDKGESEAIALCKELNADLLLIDERKGTKIARSLGINTIGLIGVLLLSKKKNYINTVKQVLDDLIMNTTFRIDNTLYSNVLKQANEQ